ncbi:hypothetical protein [Bacillus thermotolerans]|uniref:hypothetical protein n=1 Tax=Bacillus thermotolerans TaxID=1221996 RepID=UPI00057FDAA0|nr:hypothetical protein [Bacillus thermotolerans]KKB34606.1 hypothetical protein QY97_02255 [Bacillus thermotolerans]
MRKQQLRKLLQKALLFRLMTNIDNLVENAKISHSTLSFSAGQQHSWFNDAFNNNEDISISSLTKILSAVNDKVDLADYKLIDLFDKNILIIASRITAIKDEKDEQIPSFILTERELFTDLLGDWGLLKAKKKLSEEEQQTAEEVRSILIDRIKEEQ